MLIAPNLSSHELCNNRRPDIRVEMHAGDFLVALPDTISSAGNRWMPWLDQLRDKASRHNEIKSKTRARGELIDSLHFVLRMEEAMTDDAILVDLVATARCIVRPRAPLSWIDPGVFGTLASAAAWHSAPRSCGRAGYQVAEGYGGVKPVLGDPARVDFRKETISI